MRRMTLLWMAAAAGVLLATALDARAAVDPAVSCQKTIVRALLGFKRDDLGNHYRCRNARTKLNIPTACPDTRAADQHRAVDRTGPSR